MQYSTCESSRKFNTTQNDTWVGRSLDISRCTGGGLHLTMEDQREKGLLLSISLAPIFPTMSQEVD